MTELFANMNAVKTRLVDYLYSINENINWTDFLNRHGTMSDVRILKRIRSLIWVDKSIEYESVMHSSTNYFKYYISLLFKFVPILYKDERIYVIPPKNAQKPSILDEFQIDVESKFSILKRVLNIMNIGYTVIDMEKINDSDVSNMKILIPLGSITYKPSELVLFDSFKGIVIPDGYDNICFDKNDEILNNFILNIKALTMSSDDVSEIINPSYTMFYIKRR